MPNQASVDEAAPSSSTTPGWTFLTNHAHVLLAIAHDPRMTLRDVASRVGITERATQKIVADLATAGYLTRTREGRRNHYTIATHRPFRHPMTAGHEVDELLRILGVGADAGAGNGAGTR